MHSSYHDIYQSFIYPAITVPPFDGYEISAFRFRPSRPTRNISLMSPDHVQVSARSASYRIPMGFAHKNESGSKLDENDDENDDVSNGRGERRRRRRRGGGKCGEVNTRMT